MKRIAIPRAVEDSFRQVERQPGHNCGAVRMLRTVLASRERVRPYRPPEPLRALQPVACRWGRGIFGVRAGDSPGKSAPYVNQRKRWRRARQGDSR